MIPPMRGKKVFITGASRGIGAAISVAFADLGAYVIGTRTSPGNSGGSCSEWVISDFSDVKQIYSCAEILRGLEPDVLINNVGINQIASFSEIDPADFLRIQQVNLFAPFILCQAAIPSMRKKEWGRIINISSIWGLIGKEYRASYAASKFALDGITLALASEYSKNGILANCVSPGFTDTELTHQILGEEGTRQIVAMVPLRRMAVTSEIARFVAWLGSENNTYITGQNIPIDGGFTRV